MAEMRWRFLEEEADPMDAVTRLAGEHLTLGRKATHGIARAPRTTAGRRGDARRRASAMLCHVMPYAHCVWSTPCSRRRGAATPSPCT